MSWSIEVATEDICDGKPLLESIPAEPLSSNQYRVLASPGFANGFAAGDIIELLDSDGRFKVIERANNVCVQIFFAGDKRLAMREFSTRLGRVGGRLDGGRDGDGGHLLIYTIPYAGSFQPIEETLTNLPAEIQLETWMYGNVYGASGEPLNWWKK